MEFYNEFTFTFKSKEESEKAIDIIKTAIENSPKYDFDKSYAQDFRKNMANNLYLYNREMEFYFDINIYDVILSRKCYLTASDALEFFVDLLKRIGDSVGDYKFSVSNNDTYEDSYIEAKKENGVLTIDTVYYPEGYCDSAECEECSFEVTDRAEWDGSPIVKCPECDAEVDLAELFKVEEEIKHFEIVLNDTK